MIVVALVVLGLALGSFVNALVWRLRRLDVASVSKAERKKLSITTGRSMCTHCGHVLAWYDLLPVLSWLWLKGRCRYCGKRIEDSPVVEVATAVLFVWSYAVWPYGWHATGVVLFGLWLVFLVGFVALAVYDLRWMELPNKIVYLLIGLAVVQVLFKLTTAGDRPDVVVQAVTGFLAIGGVFYGLFQVSDGKWIGGGDVKLGFMIGPLAGFVGSLMVLFVASLLGTFASLPLLVTKRLKTTSRIPFGPFLLAATIVAYLYGSRLTDLYLGLF